jgi:hypothetical protein
MQIFFYLCSLLTVGIISIFIYAYFIIFHPILLCKTLFHAIINPRKKDRLVRYFKEDYEKFKKQCICEKEGHVWISDEKYAPCIRNCGYHKPS